MEDKNLWTTFEKTGSVVDYLRYRGISTYSEKQTVGEETFESDNYGDRNDTVRSTYR